MRRARSVALGLTLLLVAPATPVMARKRVPLPEAPARFEERWYSVDRPPGEGWALMQRSGDGIGMARTGKAPDESYAAAVKSSGVASVLPPEEFLRTVEEQHRASLGTGRFELKQWSVALDPSRPQACMRYRFATVDAQAERVSGGSAPMLLEGVGLTCQAPGGVPVVIDAHWSHRTEIGREDPALEAEASAWLASLVLAEHEPATPAPAEDGAAELLRLAERSMNGDGVPNDLVEARRLLELAAAQGSAAGRLNLAMMLDEGMGGPVDDARAVTLYREAAEVGEPRAQVNLGVMLWRGEGVARDAAEALAWLNVAVITSADPVAHDAATKALSSFSDRATRDERRRGQARAIAWLREHGYTATVPP